MNAHCRCVKLVVQGVVIIYLGVMDCRCEAVWVAFQSLATCHGVIYPAAKSTQVHRPNKSGVKMTSLSAKRTAPRQIVASGPEEDEKDPGAAGAKRADKPLAVAS